MLIVSAIDDKIYRLSKYKTIKVYELRLYTHISSPILIKCIYVSLHENNTRAFVCDIALRNSCNFLIKNYFQDNFLAARVLSLKCRYFYGSASVKYFLCCSASQNTYFNCFVSQYQNTKSYRFSMMFKNNYFYFEVQHCMCVSITHMDSSVISSK